MVAFIVIGVHNWQTTAQGQPSEGSWRPASSSSHAGRGEGCRERWTVPGGEDRGRKGTGRSEGDWRGDAGSLTLIAAPVWASWPSFPHTRVLLVHVHTNTRTQMHLILFFLYSKILTKRLIVFSPWNIKINKADMVPFLMEPNRLEKD